MNIKEYCGKTEFATLQFIFSLTDHMSRKISKRELISIEQIIRYVKKQINCFFKSLNLKSSVSNLYKSEVFNTVMFKIKYIIKDQKYLLIV